MMPVWLFLGSLSLGLPNILLSVLVPLKCTWIPFLLHIFLNFSPVPGMYDTTMVMFFLLLLLSCGLLLLGLFLLFGWLGLVNFWWHCLRLQSGHWHCCNAVFICWSSLSSCSYVEQTTLALCANLLNTLCLAEMWWLLYQCKYWSVWVGFL